MPFFYTHPMKTLKSLFQVLLLVLSASSLRAQLILSEPALPTEADAVAITFDASLGSGGLEGYTGNVYAHTGVLTNLSSGSSGWRYVKSDWGENTEECKLTRIAENTYTLEIGPSVREYYGVPASETITHMAFVFRSEDSSQEGKGPGGSDIFVEVYPEGLEVSIILPEKNQILEPGSMLDFEAAASMQSPLKLYQNDALIKSLNGENLSHTFTFGDPGDYWLKVTAESGEEQVADSVFVHVMGEQVIAPLPEGMKDGINYLDDQRATLVLYAPFKEHVYVIGDFNEWIPGTGYRMARDGDRWWLTLEGLEPGVEYAYQYFIDGELCIADPYTEKTLDPNDKYIPESTYPGLKPYPQGLTTGICAILETGQASYPWDHADFQQPPVEQLVVYELLVRDFIAAHDWKTLTDTLDYFSKLGVNAIELMPVNEFEGNESWGYNPSFYFAPDKYYGPAEDLKVFIDSLHGRGIAVIIDMVLNHSYSQSPLVQLYFENGQVSSQNPWYNVESPNPVYFWGYDFDHESPQTEDFVDRVNSHWLEEFRVDGFRFDFTKGFTNKPGEGWAYDASRIDILKRMADEIWKVNPDAYVILEHLSDNSEETVLADYGMMLWGNLNYAYNEATMGYNESNKSNFSGISYQQRGWQEPHLLGYMESHDEERLMFKNLQFGNSQGDYNIQELETALERLELAGAFFFTVPGPKMIWQFGELGYDFSIDTDCRVCNKPIRWDYNSGLRRRVYEVWGALIELKKTEPAFSSDDFTLAVSTATKRIEINHPDMDVRIIGNFGVSGSAQDANFSRAGRWYEFFTGDSLEVSAATGLIELDPGEYRVYTTKRLQTPDITASLPKPEAGPERFLVYPNPTRDLLRMEALELPSSLRVINTTGQVVASIRMEAYQDQIDLGFLDAGVYVLQRESPSSGTRVSRVLKL